VGVSCDGATVHVARARGDAWGKLLLDGWVEPLTAGDLAGSVARALDRVARTPFLACA